jgi:3-hydroxyisobutyrate dehydrogenase-like beta-hydroxyacid dehydrogenase
MPTTSADGGSHDDGRSTPLELHEMKVAVLGTGRMGAAIARRLAAEGFELSLWNRTRAKAEELGIGVVADTPAGAVKNTDAALTILTGPDAVREVYLSHNGALSGATGQTFFEMSTAGPDVVHELHPLAQMRRSRIFDAPVLGSVSAAETGNLVVLVGGEDGVDDVRAPIQALGEIRRIGPLGSAATLKLVSNSMLAVVSAAGAELLAAGTAAQLQRGDVYWVLQRFAPYLNTREAGFLHGQFEPVTFALRDMVKDLDLALRLFSGPDALTPLVAAVRDIFARAAERLGDRDLSAIASHYGFHSG